MASVEIKSIALAGLKKGWDGFFWMLKILIPVSFFTFLLESSGLLGQIDFIFQPDRIVRIRLAAKLMK